MNAELVGHLLYEVDSSRVVLFMQCYDCNKPDRFCYQWESLRYSYWNYFTELLGEVDPVLAA